MFGVTGSFKVNGIKVHGHYPFQFKLIYTFSIAKNIAVRKVSEEILTYFK
ncbi:hypothetical protein C240_2391 [Enterococcus sp. 5H]|nr:hypothetical protein [Enterococcus sp. 5H]